MSEKRIEFVDLLKGTAILMVVWGHSVLIYPINFMYEGSIWKYVQVIIYSFHMPLFIFISGWLYTYTNKRKEISYKSYYLPKVKYILLPYIIFSILYLLAEIIGIYFSLINKQGLQSIRGILFELLNTFIWIETTHYWFLYVLFSIFLIFPLLEKYVFINYGIEVLFIVILIISSYFAYFIDNNIFLWKTTMEYLVFFHFGCLIFPYTEKIKTIKAKYVFMIPFLILIIFDEKADSLFMTNNVFIQYIYACLGILFTTSACYYIKLNSLLGKFIIFSGVFSLQYYLFSDFIFVLSREFYFTILGIRGAEINVLIFLSTILVNYLICRYILYKIYLLRIISGVRFT